MLKPETEPVWNFLKTEASLRDFTLIGGTALALRIGHRISEDLDFCYLDLHLPRKALQALEVKAAQNGFSFVRSDDPAALDEFEIGGMELHDFQQDFLVNNSVKLSFFTADKPLVKSLNPVPGKGAKNQGPRIAELDELFRSKAIVSSKRSKSRDWFDLFALLNHHGFTIGDYRDAFIRADIPKQWESGLARICSGNPQANDEGFEDLMENPPDLEEISSFFRKQRDQIEIDLAKDTNR